MGDIIDFVVLVLFVLFMVFLVNGFVKQVGARKAARLKREEEARQRAADKKAAQVSEEGKKDA